MMKRVFKYLLAGILLGNVINGAEGFILTDIPPACVTAPPGLVGLWPGDANPNDVVGGDNGSLSDSGASYANGKVGAGFYFDGSTGYLQIPDSDALKPTNVTLEAWVWLDPNTTPGPGGESIIFKKNTRQNFFEGYSILKQTIDNGDGTFTDRFQTVISSSGGNQVYVNSTTIAQRGVWYHVAATYDGTTLTLFVNGVAEASIVAGFDLDYGTKPIFIGATGEAPPYASYFGGIIDEPSIYNRALTTNEIAAIYNAGAGGKCNDGPHLPYIITQPASQSVVEGGDVNLYVNAGGGTGGPLSYQWMFKGKAIVGFYDNSLSIHNIHPNQAGNYKVRVTDGNTSVTSAPAIITVRSQNILIYSYAGNEKNTAPGNETSYGFSGQLIIIPDTATATFIGWATISGKKQYWVTPGSDYLLFTVKGSQNRSYTVFGKASDGAQTQPNGALAERYLSSFIHRGQNANLTIGTGKNYLFPNTLTFNNTQVFLDSQTTNYIMLEAASNYSFLPSNTKTANDTGQTVADLISAQVKSLVKQGYQPQ